MEGIPLLKSDYKPVTEIYEIDKPAIVSGGTYHFETSSKLTYEVTFGKKKNNYLGNILNFSVISDEYEDEYSETNKGEVFKIISTMIEIVRAYHEAHPYSNSYEFSGEYKDNEDPNLASIRTRLYVRAAKKVLDFENWEIISETNKIVVQRKPRND